MKKIVLFVLVFLFVASVAFAVQETEKAGKVASPAQKAQYEKMKACNAEAKSQKLKGDKRKAFMKSCLSGKTSVENVKADKTSKQEK